MMSKTKELIEIYVHLIDERKFEMLLYLAYRDRYSNPVVYELREILDSTQICSMSESRTIASKLFIEAFLSYIQQEKVRRIPSLRMLLYGTSMFRAPFVNQFGLSLEEINEILNTNARDLGLSITTNVNTLDSEVYYKGAL